MVCAAASDMSQQRRVWQGYVVVVVVVVVGGVVSLQLTYSTGPGLSESITRAFVVVAVVEAAWSVPR